MIVGHGIDIVDVARIEQMVDKHGDHFLERCFTPGERSYAAANPKRVAEHLAGRFAAKEAVLKALGTGWSGQIAWTDVETVRLASGRPTIDLHGACESIAAKLNVTAWWLSISHVKGHAIASAIAESLPQG